MRRVALFSVREATAVLEASAHLPAMHWYTLVCSTFMLVCSTFPSPSPWCGVHLQTEQCAVAAQQAMNNYELNGRRIAVAFSNS